MKCFLPLLLLFLLSGCASTRVYTEKDAPPTRDPRIEQMPIPDFLRPASTITNQNLESIKARWLPSEKTFHVPIQLSEKQTLITAADLREIAAIAGRFRPHLEPYVIRQVALANPADGLLVLLSPDIGLQLFLVDGKWQLANRFFLKH